MLAGFNSDTFNSKILVCKGILHVLYTVYLHDKAWCDYGWNTKLHQSSCEDEVIGDEWDTWMEKGKWGYRKEETDSTAIPQICHLLFKRKPRQNVSRGKDLQFALFSLKTD